MGYNYWERKLYEILEGKEVKAEEVAEVISYLIKLGIEEWVLSMFGYFDSKFVVDFVALSRQLGNPDEDRKKQQKWRADKR